MSNDKHPGEVNLAVVIIRARELRRAVLHVGASGDVDVRRMTTLREFREGLEVFRELVILGNQQVESRLREFLKSSNYREFLGVVDRYQASLEPNKGGRGDELRWELVNWIDDLILSA